MKKTIALTFVIFSFLCVSYLGFRFTYADDGNRIASPLPKFLTSFENKQVTTLDIWKPFLSWFENKKLKEPELTARSVLMYSLTDDKITFEKDSDKKIPMASLTKVMTAIIALENPKPDDKYLVRNEYLVGESTMGLKAGEVLSLEELLYGLILHSGNDASETIAEVFLVDD